MKPITIIGLSWLLWIIAKGEGASYWDLATKKSTSTSATPTSNVTPSGVNLQNTAPSSNTSSVAGLNTNIKHLLAAVQST